MANQLELNHDEDDWEYEYDEEKTEDFYFTLDLTTHVPDALASKEKSANGRLMPTVPIVAEQDDDDQDDDDRDDASNPDAARDRNHRKSTDEQSSLQFLDLHSDAPLMKFGKAIYRGQWSTELGTQFYVSRPHVIEEPLRPGNIADVIGISRVRLLSRPVTLQQRPDWVDESVQKHVDVDVDSGASPMEAPATAPSVFNDDEQRPTLVPRENLIKPEHRAQAAFLERLSEIKLAKGEMDPVPATYGMIKYENPPEGWEAIQQQALEEDEKEAQARRHRMLEVVEAKPRKRRRRRYSEIGLQTKASAQMNGDTSRPGHARRGVKPGQEIRAALGLQTAPPDEGEIESENDDEHGSMSEQSG